jgi:hypothetical protein
MPWTLHIEYDNVQNQIAPLWEMVGIRFSLIFAFQTENDNASKGSDAHSQGQLKGHRGRLTGYEILGYRYLVDAQQDDELSSCGALLIKR